MRAKSQVSKELKALARQAEDIAITESAGEMGRRQNWSYFVKDSLMDHSRRELAMECIEAMSKEERRHFFSLVEAEFTD